MFDYALAVSGFAIHDKADIDHVWRTCCALHNLLLEHDDLASHWQNGVAHPTDGEFTAEETPGVFTRLAQHGRAPPRQDLSGMSVSLDGGLRDRVASDRDHAYDSFHAALVTHFSYRWHLPAGHPDAVVWPRRNGARARVHSYEVDQECVLS